MNRSMIAALVVALATPAVALACDAHRKQASAAKASSKVKLAQVKTQPAPKGAVNAQFKP